MVYKSRSTSTTGDEGDSVRFHRLGFDFEHPDTWTVDVDDAADGRGAVTAYSPDGSFWSVSGHEPDADAADLTAAVVAEMRRQYRDLDSEPAADRVAGRDLRGYDLAFYCLDLTNTAQVRCLATPAAAFLIFCQAEDRDWDRLPPVFAAMTASFVAGLDAAFRSAAEP